jgi:ribosome assembly protein YihI (activator of Der GTPase)
LVNEDVGKSIREIAIEVSQKEIVDWFENNSQEDTILERISGLEALVDIEQPISDFVIDMVDARVEELGGSSFTPATQDKLGVVKLDGQTIKMNDED